ncbi:hypothetical protein HDV00_011708 [Rhizophlyctis rosea]|nr:hypothetical protein HDV00_011708 [Rhizophlyctis rosea]
MLHCLPRISKFQPSAARGSRTLLLAHARLYSTPPESTAIVFDEYGSPDKVLKFKTIPPTSPSPSEVQVKILAAPINPADLNQIQGEGLGVGTWRTHATAPEDDFIKLDAKGISVVSAATVAVNPCTAYRMLKDFVKLQPGDTIIQNGANSSVGQAVIQLARAWGIKTINVVRDRPDIEELTEKLTSLGADLVVEADKMFQPEAIKKAKKLGPPPRLGLNCVGGKSALNMTRVLGPSAHMVTYGGMSLKPLSLPTGAFIFQDLTCHGFWMTRWYQNHSPEERSAMVDEIFGLIREGKFKEPWCEQVDFEQGLEAVKLSVGGGKRVLIMK